MYIEKISTKFDEVIGSLESQRQHIEKYIDEKKVNQKNQQPKFQDFRHDTVKNCDYKFAQYKRVVQGNR